MADLTDYTAFVAIVEQGSLTAAARHLGRSLQAVSRSLASLERELTVTLVQRTTRQSRPTEAGLAFLALIRPALAQLALARDTVGEHAQGTIGSIRIAAPALFGPAYLMPVLAAYLAEKPGISLDLALDQGFANPVAESIDLAVRFGELPDSSLKARWLGDLRQATFATPTYLADAGDPTDPSDLTTHRCIVRTSARDGARWTFMQDGQTQVVTVSGPFRSDSAAACNEAAALGLGIARAPFWQVRGHFDAGRLVRVLDRWQLPGMPVHLVWPNAPLPSRVRGLIDHLSQILSNLVLEFDRNRAGPDCGARSRTT